jgi:hypothetical protein
LIGFARAIVTSLASREFQSLWAKLPIEHGDWRDMIDGSSLRSSTAKCAIWICLENQCMRSTFLLSLSQMRVPIPLRMGTYSDPYNGSEINPSSGYTHTFGTVSMKLNRTDIPTLIVSVVSVQDEFADRAAQQVVEAAH